MGNTHCKLCSKRKTKQQLAELQKQDSIEESKSNVTELMFNADDEYQFKLEDYEQILKDKAYRSVSSLPASLIQKKSGAGGNPTLKQQRIFKEYQVLRTQSPVYYTNSIFTVSDESNTDHMQALITGATDTPYAYGVFLFDIFCHDSFPAAPPEMKLLTTGSGTVRFNPNLYSNGYVCLSLLGTWSGNNGETWNPLTSNIALVLQSIQSLVMNEGVLFQEPSYISYKKNKDYINLNNGYCNIVKYATVKYAMNDMITHPPKEFADIIKIHFYINKQEILKTVDKWLSDADKEQAEYDRLVNSHNYTLAAKFKAGSYKTDLSAEIEALKNNLQSLTYKKIIEVDMVKSFVAGQQAKLSQLKKKKEEESKKKQLEQQITKVIQSVKDEKHKKETEVKQKLKKRHKKNNKLKFF